MTATAAAAGSTPAPKSLPARIFGIITSPKETFQRVAAAPKILGVLLITIVLAGIFSALPLTTDAGQQALIAKQEQSVKVMESLGVKIDPDKMHEQLEKGAARAPVMAAVSALVGAPIVQLILGGIFFAIFNAALGGEARFKQVWAVIAHAGVIFALSAIFSGTVNYFRGSIDSIGSLGALVPMLPETSFVANFLGAIDVFIIWWMVVLAMGIAVLYRRRTQPIALTLLSIYAVIAVVVAVFKSRGA